MSFPEPPVGETGAAAAPPPIPTPPAAAGLTGAGAARRRFGRAGAGATGVILTLNSQPGMAAAAICKAPSGSLSGGLHSFHGPAPRCDGVSPGYWKNHSGWPAGTSPTFTFGSIFSCNSAHRNYKNTTCLNILSHQDFDTNNLGMHLMAAYLNAMDGRTPFLTVANIKSMWTEWQSKGYYNPNISVKWYAYDIVTYLTGTQS